MAESSGSVDIVIDDKVFKGIIPPGDSLLEEEKATLLGALDLESFVQDLGRVGKYIRVAYNGIGAAGPEFQDLQIQVQRIGFDISKLCDKSAVTIASFKNTTKSILFELKSTYQFLQINNEVMALDSFTTLGQLAEKMAKAAENLQKEFESQEDKVAEALEEAQRRKATKKLKISELETERERTEVDMKRQEELAKEHEKLEAEFRAERHRYEKKEDKAMSSNFLGRLGNMFTSYFGLGNLFDDDRDREVQANRWRQKSIEKLENEKEQRKLKQEALQAMAELMHDIKSSHKQENLAAIAVDALHEASKSMKFLILLLRQAALFWNQLREHCQGLVDDTMQKHIQKFVDTSSAQQRREYWTSNLFKEKMYRYICKWVALHNISATYLDQIKKTQRDLYKYIVENPTYEESKCRLKDLAREFEKDLEVAHEQIEEKNSKAERDIKELKASEDDKDH